ncbi:VOC family protein [Streptomyces rimosus]|uniref:VOC family protein n=1 Tax=Streptomyces rimosus TaxID=1927 RepID=UPI00379D91CD
MARAGVRPDRRGDFRTDFTSGGPPFIELIEGPPGSPWDASGGARFDHIGFWTADVRAGSRRLAEEGMPVDFSGCPYGRPFAHHRTDSVGARVELVDVGRQPAFPDRWHPGCAPMLSPARSTTPAPRPVRAGRRCPG